MTADDERHVLSVLATGKMSVFNCTPVWLGPLPIWSGTEILFSTGFLYQHRPVYMFTILHYTLRLCEYRKRKEKYLNLVGEMNS